MKVCNCLIDMFIKTNTFMLTEQNAWKVTIDMFVRTKVEEEVFIEELCFMSFDVSSFVITRQGRV